MSKVHPEFQAMADAARLALGETSVNELAGPFDMSLPAVSKHLKVLEKAGLISRSREAQYRPCKLEPQHLMPVDEWLTAGRFMSGHSWRGCAHRIR